MKALLRLLLAGFSVIPALAWSATQTLITLNSQPGDYIGQGLQQTYTPADGPFTVTTINNGGVRVSFHTPDYSHFWDLEFGPPTGRKLVVNEYEGAQTFAFHSPMRPGLDVFGDARGCNTLGRFMVEEIVWNADGTIARLAVDFEQHCEGFQPALYGSVRYNSGFKLVPRIGVGAGMGLKGNQGTSDAEVILSLSMPSSVPVTVQYATSNVSAIAGTDYVATAGNVTFAPGQTAIRITIPIVGDRLARGSKLFHVDLSNPVGAVIGTRSNNVSILDPNGIVTLLSMYGQPGDYISQGQLLITALDGTFTTARNLDNGVNVSIQTLDLWAACFAAPNNATLKAGSYTNAQRFPFQAPGLPGLSVYGAGRGCNTLTGSFNVLQANYDTAGNVKSFSADFEQHCEGFSPALLGTLRVNAKWRQLSVTDAVIDAGQSTATFTITLNPASTGPVLVSFGTVDGTAVAGVDYASTTVDVMFSPGEISKTIIVPLLSPTAGRIFYGRLSNPSGSPMWISQGSATYK